MSAEQLYLFVPPLRENRHARIAAYTAMSTTAERMCAARQRGDQVLRADLRTSMNDLRAALSISFGVALDDISRDGYINADVAQAVRRARRT